MDNALLLIVDVQEGFMNSAETKAVVPRINALVAKWKQKNLPIIYSRFVNLEGSNWEKLRDWHELKAEPDTKLAADLKVVPTYVFKKSTYSAWSSDAAQVCAIHGIDNVIIVGVDTNECVLATALSVFDAGFTPWLVEDCCMSGGGQDVHAAAIKLIKPLLGEQQVIQSSVLL